jgi:hypothetical protein
MFGDTDGNIKQKVHHINYLPETKQGRHKNSGSVSGSGKKGQERSATLFFTLQANYCFYQLQQSARKLNVITYSCTWSGWKK